MAEPSKLDRTQNINARFNNAGDLDHEKRLAQYQLMPEERKDISDMRQVMNDKTAQEKQSFNTPEEYLKRRNDKYAELAQRNNTPTPEHLPPGARDRTLPKHQLLQMADTGVKQDHANRLSGFQADYRKGMNTVLTRAAEQGRGPQPQQQQQREQTREQAAPTQDFNRAGQNQQGPANENNRDRDR